MIGNKLFAWIKSERRIGQISRIGIYTFLSVGLELTVLANQRMMACENVIKGAGEVKKSFYEDNPTYIRPVSHDPTWIFSDPEAQGMQKSKLVAAAKELAKVPELWSFLVVRNGVAIAESYYHGSNEFSSNNVHSASKSILSAALGIAIDQSYIKSIDQKIVELLPDRYKRVNEGAHKNMTVRHLLTMTGGLNWTEDSTEYTIQKSEDWVKSILKLKRLHPPGQNFNYSTAMTHLMSVILTEATGMSTCEFVHKNLFDKLGIRPDHWGSDPQGYFSGGYNLYMTPRELAKFGLLYLHSGRWNGNQVVPSEWVKQSLTSAVVAEGDFSYGFNWWLRKIAGHDVAIAWGYGGQFIYLIKDLDLIVVMTTNTKDYSPEFDGEFIVRDYIIPAVRE